MGYDLTRGKLGYKIDDVLVGLKPGTTDTPEAINVIEGGIKTANADFAGRTAFNTIFGESSVGWRNDNVSIQFQYNISTRDVVVTKSGSGAESHANAMAVCAIGAAVGECQVSSKDALRYRPGHEALAQFTSVYSGAQSGVDIFHGPLNANDGFCFGYQGTTFGIWYVRNGSETFIPQSTWLGDKLDGAGNSGFTINPANMNIYCISYGWLGIAPAIFSVYTGYTTGWRVVHWIDKVNTQTTPHLGNPSIPVTMKTRRTSGSGTAASVSNASTRFGNISGENENNSSDRWFANTLLDVSISGSGVRNNVFSITNNATFQGKTNHVPIELGVVTFDNSANKTVAFYGVKGATLSGATGPTSVDATNSVVSIYTGGTLSGGTQGPATVIKAGSDRRTEVLNTGIIIYPGETFTFEAVAASAITGTISLSARWVERF